MDRRFKDTARKRALANCETTYLGIDCVKNHGGLRFVTNKKCLKCQAERQKTWRARNPLKQSGYSAKHRAAHPERVLEMSRRWVRDNRAQHNASGVRWAKNNREKASAIARNRRARIAAAEGSHTADHIDAIFEAQGRRCAYCRIRLSKRSRQVDHIVPLKMNGGNGPRNLQILCKSCNSSKNAKDPVSFAQSIGFLL